MKRMAGTIIYQKLRYYNEYHRTFDTCDGRIINIKF